MGQALELFKSAGIEELLSPAALGAGVGGLGMGAASYLNNDDENASFGDKVKQSLGSGLKGALLGGAAGAGIGGIQQLADKVTAHPEGVQNILNSTSQQLDTDAFGVHHPFAAQLGNFVRAPEWLTGGVGAGLGMGAVKSMRNAGNYIADAATKKVTNKAFHVNPERAATALNGARGDAGAVGGTDRLMNKFINMFKGSDVARKGAVENLTRNNYSAVERLGGVAGPPVPGQHSPGALAGVQKLLSHDNYGQPGSQSILDKLMKRSPSESTARASRSILDSVHSPLKANAGRYAMGAGAGAATALGGQYAASKLFDTYLNGKYSPEQLQLWNELSRNQ